MAFLQQLQKGAKLKHVEVEARKAVAQVDDVEASKYQAEVLLSTVEKWCPLLLKGDRTTFDTEFVPISRELAHVFVAVIERFQALPASDKASAEVEVLPEERPVLDSFKKDLDAAMDRKKAMAGLPYCFVKTSSRSAKDTALFQSQFRANYHKYLQEAVDNGTEPAGGKISENTKVQAMIRAGTDSLMMADSNAVLGTFLRSERIMQDMQLALDVFEAKGEWNQNFCVREWVNCDPDMEFRGFVYGNRLCALAQYNYLCFWPRLAGREEILPAACEKFFNEKIKHILEPHTSQYVVDFAVVLDKDGNIQRIWVIELNPFLFSTDASERDILEGRASAQLSYRWVPKPRSGVKASLATDWRALLDEEHQPQ